MKTETHWTPIKMNSFTPKTNLPKTNLNLSHIGLFIWRKILQSYEPKKKWKLRQNPLVLGFIWQ